MEVVHPLAFRQSGRWRFNVDWSCVVLDKCRNEHPAKVESNSFVSRNPFDALGGGSRPRGINTRSQGTVVHFLRRSSLRTLVKMTFFLYLPAPVHHP